MTTLGLLTLQIIYIPTVSCIVRNALWVLDCIYVNFYRPPLLISTRLWYFSWGFDNFVVIIVEIWLILIVTTQFIGQCWFAECDF